MKRFFYGLIVAVALFLPVSFLVEEKLIILDKKDPDFVSLAFVGDIMLDRGVRNSVIKNFNNNYSALFEKINILKNFDMVFANLEGPASDQGTDQKNLYSFRMDPVVISTLKDADINILSVANNHMGDWGQVAFVDTLARLRENEILFTGGGNTKIESETPTVVKKYGIKIGFLGFSDVGPNWMEASVDKAGILLTNNPNFDEITKNEKLFRKLQKNGRKTSEQYDWDKIALQIKGIFAFLIE